MTSLVPRNNSNVRPECAPCDGTGWLNGQRPIVCPSCHGKGVEPPRSWVPAIPARKPAP